MKHLLKNIAILGFSILFLLLSIKSSYAEETYDLKTITATTTKTVELELDKKTNKNFNDSDFEVYKSIGNTAKKDEGDEYKVILTLESDVEKNTSYSLISLSSINGDIIFTTGDDIIGKEIQNTGLESDSEGIKSILIKDPKTVVLTFVQKIDSDDFEFQFLKTLTVASIYTIPDSSKIKVTLEGELLNNQQYLSTVTYFQTESLEKIEIKKGVKYFTTGELAKYEGPTEEELAAKEKTGDDISLEEKIMKKLDETEKSNSGSLSESEENLKEELNSASESSANSEKTQLEKLALSQKETPDTGAETWVLVMLTFIINTFYFLSRRKKNVLA